MREMPEGRGFLDSDLEVGFTNVSAKPVICRILFETVTMVDDG
jgi:hypothetical protein